LGIGLGPCFQIVLKHTPEGLQEKSFCPELLAFKLSYFYKENIFYDV
jgi:hypothetical protein